MHCPIAILAACMVAAALTFPAQAQSNRSAADPTLDDTMVAGGFLDGHPDLKFRNMGLDAYGRKDFVEAINRFKQAASYGDKPSQAVVAEMYWDGIAGDQDRVLGLIWMDMAAERGYAFFSKKRDYYWNALTSEERKQALARARNVFAEYGDAVAEPRLAAALRRERGRMTGSRVGSMTSSVQVIVPGYGSIDASKFYDPQFWDPKQYRAWQDAYWTDLKPGRVEVGEPVNVDTPAVESTPPSGQANPDRP